MNKTAFGLLISVLALGAFGCASDSEPESEDYTGMPASYDASSSYEVDIDAADLTPEITHTLFPTPVGAKWVYEKKSGDQVERIEVSVEAGTKDVWGAKARVIRDTVSLNGVMIEDTHDWYAQDDDGHVWYLGEDTAEYANGELVCHCGAWEAGKQGALPGVIMLAEPKVGYTYRQEYFAGEAEDIATVVSLDETVTVPAGTFHGCLKTKDGSALESGSAYKYYCPGVGLTLEEEDGERVELVQRSGL